MLKKGLMILKAILVVLSLYLMVTSAIPFYWIFVAAYWALNLATDFVKK